MKGSEVKVEKVSKQFGNFNALKQVSIDIKKGEFYSLLGPSGCGKTTLLRIIAGFEQPSEGFVYLDNVNVLPIPANKRHVNTVFQSYALFPHLSVFENVAFPLRLRKVDNTEIKKQVTEYLELVKLPNEGHKLPSQLSGGQRQRVAIARALINHPSVLLLDEPLAALDAKLRQHMLVELDAIHDKIGITFIYVTHDQQEAISVSDRVAVMSEGQVQQIGAPKEIYESPANSFVAKFIGETNFLRGKVVSILNEKYAQIEIPSLGQFEIFIDKKLSMGDSVRLTIRPEKIRITPEKPDAMEHRNIAHGKVDEIIYTGFQSKYFVKVGQDLQFKIFKQHVQFESQERPINWKDEVYIWWSSDDGFVVEVEKQ